MGLLTRGNPEASPSCVIRRAFVGGIIGLAFILVMLSASSIAPRHRPAIIAAAVVLGAGTGAVVEWHHADEPEDEGCY